MKLTEKRDITISHCEKIGVEKYWEMDGESRGQTFFQIKLKDGTMGYLKNLSPNQIERLRKEVSHDE